ncbi:MAG TPA: PaaI family thioesterase [Nitrospirota bacterium]|nr:PaaI family thioesterase [Nitrospirota bacterium]
MNQLRDNERCYVCGKKNPGGLAVDFVINAEARSISAVFTPSDIHQGYEGIVHGGILSSLLDEAMVKLAFNLGIPAVTAEIIVTFKAPATPGIELFITGMITQETKKLILAEARIERGPVVIAKAKGKLLRIGPVTRVRSPE